MYEFVKCHRLTFQCEAMNFDAYIETLSFVKRIRLFRKFVIHLNTFFRHFLGLIALHRLKSMSITNYTY